MSILHILGFIWCIPNSLIGFIVYLFTFGSSITEFKSKPYPHIEVIMNNKGTVYKIFKFISGGLAGFTIGSFIFICYENYCERLLKHELEHVRQNMVYGIFKIPLYYLFGAIAFLQGKRPYMDNYFELLAQDAEIR